MILLALLPLARALTCDQVSDMLGVGVPSDLVAQTVRDAGPAPQGLPGCLRDRGAPEAVIAAAEAVGEAPVVLVAPEPVPELPLPRGISARDLRHPWRVTQVLYQRALIPPGVRDPLLHAWLGQEFLELDLPHSAERESVQAITLGALGPVLERSWGGLVEVAGRTGDDGTLRRLLKRVLPEDLPRPYQDQGWWLHAWDLFVQADEPGQAAIALDEISPHSPYARQATFLRAVINMVRGKEGSAARGFRDVYSLEASDRAGQLALVNLARIYYGLGNYERAAALYALVLPTASAYPRAQLELAWAELLMDEGEALDQTLAAARAASLSAWLPELSLVEALSALRAGHGPAVEARVVQALAPLRALEPTEQALTEALREARGSDWDPRAFYVAWLGPEARPPVPATLAADFRQDVRLQGLISHLAVLAAEERRIRLHPGPWQAQVGSGLLINDEEDRAALETAAGLALLHVMGERRRELADLRAQADQILALAREP